MNKFIHISIALGALALGNFAKGQAYPFELNAWDNADFRDRVMGSYGVRSPIEPEALSRQEAQFFNEQVVPVVNAGNFRAAAQALEGYITAETNANFDFTLATIYLQLSQLDRAQRYYESAIRKHPDFLRAYKNLGIVASQTGQHQKAIEYLTKAVELGENNGDTFGMLGYNYLNLGRSLQALNAYRLATTLNPGNRDWKFGLIRSLMETRNYPEAIAVIDDLLADAPDDHRLLVSKANAFIAEEEYSKAAMYLDIVRRLGKGNAATLETLGDLLVNLDIPSVAVVSYIDAVKEGMKTERALRAGEVLIAHGALEPAERLLAAVGDISEDNLSPAELGQLRSLRASVALRAGKTDEAESLLNAIVEEDPMNGRALMLLAELYGDQGDPEKAIYYYDRAALGEDENIQFDARVQAAVLQVELKDFDSAIENLSAALRIQESRRVQDYLEAVRRLRRS